MAVGFPASFKTEVDLSGGRESARDAIISTFELLGWNFEMIDSDTYIAKLGISGASWGETVTVSLVNEGMLSIRSACSFQVIDWGKNRRNVNAFLDLFTARASWRKRSDEEQQSYLNETGMTPLSRLLADEDEAQHKQKGPPGK